MNNASDKREIRKVEAQQRRQARDVKETIYRVCETTPGRSWLWSQLVDAHIFHTTFDSNPQIAAFNEGQRNAGLVLLDQIISSAPEQFLTMMRENYAGSNNPGSPVNSGEQSRSPDAGRESGKPGESGSPDAEGWDGDNPASDLWN